ncbi:hypothetical protein TELCIR_10639, partial [Teladorsagia circumcincta]
MMGGGGGVVPPVLLDEARVPRFYRDAIAACGATQQNMLPHTALDSRLRRANYKILLREPVVAPFAMAARGGYWVETPVPEKKVMSTRSSVGHYGENVPAYDSKRRRFSVRNDKVRFADSERKNTAEAKFFFRRENHNGGSHLADGMGSHVKFVFNVLYDDKHVFTLSC